VVLFLFCRVLCCFFCVFVCVTCVFSFTGCVHRRSYVGTDQEARLYPLIFTIIDVPIAVQTTQQKRVNPNTKSISLNMLLFIIGLLSQGVLTDALTSAQIRKLVRLE